MSNNAILLCGGCGRRMAPIPRCNKSLLKIRGELNIKRIIQILYKQGIREFVLATNPISLKDLSVLTTELYTEFPDISVSPIAAQDYVEGCNNVVTMRAVADHIGDSYILETDQYYKEEILERIIRKDSLIASVVYTQSRTEEDWGVVSEGGKVLKILHNNPNNQYHCLSGIYYIREDLANSLRSNLKNYEGQDIYWEELLEIPDLNSSQDCLPILEHYIAEGYSLEYDNISDLINNQLMEPQDIADLIDDYHSAIRLSSMTNTTFKIWKDGKEYALRLPGYGTDKFVDHHRERSTEAKVPLTIRPNSEYFSNDAVKLTEYLNNYRVLDNMVDIHHVVFKLHELHQQSTEGIQKVDLMQEISDYESIYKNTDLSYVDYQDTKSWVQNFLENWFQENPLVLSHRDLVPLNIMLNSEKDVKFIDWEYAGLLSNYWDLASMCCEFADEYQVDLEKVIAEVYYSYPGEISIRNLYLWIAIVDFVWSVWSLAKVVLGDDVLEYGQRRYDRAIELIKKYESEV